MKHSTALVTGATSGLGFETAAQLSEQGAEKVFVAGRTLAKAGVAREALMERTGKDVFEPVVIDLDDLGSVDAAVAALADAGAALDLLVLNAGMAPTKEATLTADGFEATVASSLIGHHRLVMGLLGSGRLSQGSRIAIAGSEAARGDVPTFSPVDIVEMAKEHFGGDLGDAIEAQIRMQEPAEYRPSDTYATAKMFVAWWARELASRLPDGMAVNAVSPGSTPETNAIRNAPFYMRYIMLPLFKLIPGMSHSVADGARRYLEVADYDSAVTGEFFASKPKKMTGPLVAIDMPHLQDEAASAALWEVTIRIAGATVPSQA